MQSWIWLPQAVYPDNQTTIYSGFQDKAAGNYTVAEFSKKYTFSEKVHSVRLLFSGDTLFQLYCNGEMIATGPPAVGGDFRENDHPRDDYYAYETVIAPNANELDFFVRVQLMPMQLCDYSKGHGGFMLQGSVTLADGTQKSISTDESWLVRKNGAFISPSVYDGSIEPDRYTTAEITQNIWHCQPAPIPVRTEQLLYPTTFSLRAGEEIHTEIELDRIYAGFPWISVNAQGEVSAELEYRELLEHPAPYHIRFAGQDSYRGFQLCSTGNILVHLKNQSDTPAQVTVGLISTHYPVSEAASTVTDDEELNQVLQLCRHNLKYCRQTLHLDSPKHCEPLACTGDYYIESLMTLFSFGDMRLAEFDLLRTAKTLEQYDGRLFHTTYSLIWVRMLYDVYMASGNCQLLTSCAKALSLLLHRFQSYKGNNGLLETPPDYMFVDWIYFDGHSLHHPPKALGQTCLNLFYFMALDHAEKIYRILQEDTLAENCLRDKEGLRTAVNSQLFDAEKGIYFEGLNTPTEEHLLGQWMPPNTPKRYYRKHANILAAYVGICDDTLSRKLIKMVMDDEIQGEYQPYFAHFLLEAVYRTGLRRQYTLSILQKWKASVTQCPKGLVEGFVEPEPGYIFDHSHAWAGTPLYSLPKALMGLDIIEPGMKKIRLNPCLLGLKQVQTELLTPHGKVICRLHQNAAPKITYPGAMEVLIAKDDCHS